MPATVSFNSKVNYLVMFVPVFHQEFGLYSASALWFPFLVCRMPSQFLQYAMRIGDAKKRKEAVALGVGRGFSPGYSHSEAERKKRGFSPGLDRAIDRAGDV